MGKLQQYLVGSHNIRIRLSKISRNRFADFWETTQEPPGQSRRVGNPSREVNQKMWVRRPSNHISWGDGVKYKLFTFTLKFSIVPTYL